MKKEWLLIYLLFSISLKSFCQVNNKDSVNKKASTPTDRNMFGQDITRGLTITADGLTDGYVMFTPPNSASVYLINRKGEVVHQWKGNYSTHVAYLQNDGSLVQSAVDPDFPVFGGGGESGRLQKITWDNKIIWDFEYANEKTVGRFRCWR